MDCTTVTTEAVCFDDGAAKASLVAHYEYGKDAAGDLVLVATRFTEADGVTVVDTSAGTVTVGACVVAPPDIEILKLCDTLADGTVVEFLRVVRVQFDANGVQTTTTSDTALDGTTSYVIAGTVGSCGQDCDAAVPRGVLTAWG